MESGDEYMESGEEGTQESESEVGSGEEAEDEGIGGGQGVSDSHEDRFHYDILEPDAIATSMANIIRQVADISELPLPKCRTLLAYFNWNLERVVESYYAGDSEAVLRKAQGAADPAKPLAQAAASSSSSSRSASEPLCCEICMEDFASEADKAGLECGHSFCRGCWRAYLRQKVMEEGVSVELACPASDCQMRVEEETAAGLMEAGPRGAEVRRRYQHLLTNSYVEASRLLRWCPRPSGECGRAVRAKAWEAGVVTCRCGKVFCFGCGEEWHEPVSCRYLKAWIKKCSDDSETSNWIAANTKECPKCQVTIEKDGGCNHMTCRSSTCKYEFCWICQGPWEPHGSAWYACNRFEDGSSKDARCAQDKSRQALLRYLHYSNRYANHQQSLRLEAKLYARVKAKMEEMQAANMSWIEVQFLKGAVDSLCQSRRTLCYTYVFAYYLQANNQSSIFEENQGDLELATEQLSEFLERDLEKENLVTLKQRVQDKARYCDNRRRALLDHVQEGLDSDAWLFHQL